MSGKMTVSKLIEELKNLDPSTRLLVKGQDGRYFDLNEIRSIEVIIEEPHNIGYFGGHEEYRDTLARHADEETEVAFFLTGIPPFG